MAVFGAERERERERERGLFKRETEHLYQRPPIHGIGRTHTEANPPVAEALRTSRAEGQDGVGVDRHIRKTNPSPEPISPWS